jgi:hypothetical protein
MRGYWWEILMDYFEVRFSNNPTVVFEEISEEVSIRYTDINGNTVELILPYSLEYRSWCISRASWMEPLPVVVKHGENIITTRVLMNRLGLSMADSILTSLETASAQIPMLKRVLILLEPSQGGIDINHPETISMISQLEQMHVLSSVQVTALRGI